MTHQASFWWKVAYGGMIAALLIPLSWLSRPQTPDDPGGKLSQLRDEYQLSPARLGEIDPASVSMNLATLGMRGVAANLLWQKAIHYKKTEDYDNLKATLNQIARLQPNFLSVWEFQAWELSYNISVEFDNYKHRYLWVKKGVDYLMDGIRFNRDSPRLLWNLGWFFGHKLGRADEFVQFRRLYRDDEDFHNTLTMIDVDKTRGPDHRPDNWLTAFEWYNLAQSVVDEKQKVIEKQSPLIFHSHPPMALINFSDAIEKEGQLDEQGQDAWRRAAVAWQEYGNRLIPTSIGQHIRLNDEERLTEENQRLRGQLNQLAPEGLDRALAEKRSQLTDHQRAVWDLDDADRTDEQRAEADGIAQLMEVSLEDRARFAPVESRREAMQIARKLTENESLERYTNSYRDIVNFKYWRTRCAAEQEDDMIRARRLGFEAGQHYSGARLEEARETYEACWKVWRTIFDRYPLLLTSPEAEDLLDEVKRYRDLLGQLDVAGFPAPDFPLLPLMELHDAEYRKQLNGAQSPPVDQEPPADEKGPTATPAPDAAPPSSQDADATPTEDAAPAGNTAPAENNPAPSPDAAPQ